MTTITREQQKQILIDTANHVISRDNTSPYSENLRELARIALAALTAEPVAYNQVQRDIMKDIIVRKLGGNLLGDKLMMADIHAVTMALIQAGFRTAPPSPVADADPVVFTDERNLHHIARGRETSLIWGKQNQEVGDIPLYRHAQPAPVVHQIMRELVSLLDEDQFARIENIALSAGVMPPQPAPVVPDEWTIQDAVKFCRETGRQDAGSAMEAWNACRTAMLSEVTPCTK